MNTPTLEIYPWSENFARRMDPIDEQHRILIELSPSPVRMNPKRLF
jgi:hypothetical protein